MSVSFLMGPSSFLQHISIPVGKAQLIGDWYENRRGAPSTIVLLIISHYYWRTDAPCANRSGGPRKKKFYWRTVPGQHCLLAEGDISAPIYWRTDPPCKLTLLVLEKGNIFRFFNIMYSFTSPIGGPNISVRLAYFHPNRLLTGLYKQETEIH